MANEERCCENCGRLSCANNVVAVLWHYCVKDNFTKYWMPKENEPKKTEHENERI